MRAPSCRIAVTIIETLVVISIISVLSGMLLPAVQKARESSYKIACASNLKQIGIAMISCHEATGILPSGGWGWGWIGDPCYGNGPQQPGGWIFNSLPYMEQSTAYYLPTSTASAIQLIQTPIKIMNCPSRRTGGPWRANSSCFNQGGFNYSLAARTDYAANCGNSPADEVSPGPPSIEAGQNGYNFNNSQFDGVVFAASYVTISMITAGTSNVYLAGEKYLNPMNYYTGADFADNENLYVGMDNDINRSSATEPMQDTWGVASTFIWGSAHPGSFNMVYCDGSVRPVSYTIDLPTHQTAARIY